MRRNGLSEHCPNRQWRFTARFTRDFPPWTAYRRVCLPLDPIFFFEKFCGCAVSRPVVMAPPFPSSSPFCNVLELIPPDDTGNNQGCPAHGQTAQGPETEDLEDSSDTGPKKTGDQTIAQSAESSETLLQSSPNDGTHQTHQNIEPLSLTTTFQDQSSLYHNTSSNSNSSSNRQANIYAPNERNPKRRRKETPPADITPARASKFQKKSGQACARCKLPVKGARPYRIGDLSALVLCFRTRPLPTMATHPQIDIKVVIGFPPALHIQTVALDSFFDQLLPYLMVDQFKELAVLKDLESFRFARKKSAWPSVILTTYIYLTVLERDSWNLENWKVKSRRCASGTKVTNNPTTVWPLTELPQSLLGKNEARVRLISSHIRTISRGSAPFFKDISENVKARVKSNMQDVDLFTDMLTDDFDAFCQHLLLSRSCTYSEDDWSSFDYKFSSMMNMDEIDG
ncbi:hypothetical protein M501DRAFT_987733 [Patellaria atrata CBS 101060]|uniref:Uncharacterized protein n=1 Tax=Patellaria atrata CBS 101060 TaxID=1346257 RepID=A0A9P4S486_9PEZI|nr:hypothetical protein M501DRAFT_987733 [Patellaria atrata CBS 101060]